VGVWNGHAPRASSNNGFSDEKQLVKDSAHARIVQIRITMLLRDACRQVARTAAERR
jgi:hypothetical protein